MNLDELIDRFRAPLTGLIAAWCSDWERATELAQDTFVAAYLGEKSYRGDPDDADAVGRWLRGIARNLHRKSRRRKRPQSLDDAGTLVAPSSAPLSTDAAAVRAVIDRLPPKSRSVIYMYYIDEVGTAEVAGLLGISARAVEGRLYRAREELRERLSAAGIGPREEGAR